MTWMFCFAEDNKIISGIENTITEPDWKIRIISKYSTKNTNVLLLLYSKTLCNVL
jgi:hypothetical protein